MTMGKCHSTFNTLNVCESRGRIKITSRGEKSFFHLVVLFVVGCRFYGCRFGVGVVGVLCKVDAHGVGSAYEVFHHLAATE